MKNAKSITARGRWCATRYGQVSAHAAICSDAGLQSQVGSAAGLPFQCADVGRTAREGLSPAWAVRTRIVVLDNLREGVLSPDVYDPGLNPLYRDVLAHYGVTALPCKVRDPDRKGKVESGVAHAQKTPLKGKKFESLEEAQAYLDHWEERWADKRIHGRTKRQVAAMFAEEKPHLQPLPLEPFRYYQYGERTVHLDGCVEVEAAYYGAPPGWIGRQVNVQWDAMYVRLLDPRTGELLREHLAASVAVIASAMRTAPGARRNIRINCWREHIRQEPTSAPSAMQSTSSGRSWNAPHPGHALAGQEIRQRGLRRCLRRGAGTGRNRVPLRAPLSGAQPASPSEPEASRSTDPRTDSVSRPDPTTNPLRGTQP